jgi:hypothetical protein
MAVVLAAAEKWKTAKEAADLAGVTPSWLIRNKDQIAHAQIGPLWLFDPESVQHWAATRKRRGGSKPRQPKAEGEP